MSIPDPDRPALKGAWPIICHLICLLQARTGALAAGAPTAPLWPLLRLTRVAESLVRRWLVLKACVDGGWPTVPVPQNRQIFSIVIPEKAPAFVRDLAQSGTVSKVGLTTRPRFLLFEPQPKMRASDYSLEPFEARRGTVSGEGSSALVRALNPEHLRRRCLSLSRVMEAPEHHVRRMARWLARANAIRRETGFGALHPFRVGWPPGASRQQKRRDPKRQDMLCWLDHLSREAVLRCASP